MCVEFILLQDSQQALFTRLEVVYPIKPFSSHFYLTLSQGIYAMQQPLSSDHLSSEQPVAFPLP